MAAASGFSLASCGSSSLQRGGATGSCWGCPDTARQGCSRACRPPRAQQAPGAGDMRGAPGRPCGNATGFQCTHQNRAGRSSLRRPGGGCRSWTCWGACSSSSDSSKRTIVTVQARWASDRAHAAYLAFCRRRRQLAAAAVGRAATKPSARRLTVSCTSIYIHRHVVATHGSLGAQLGLARRRYGGRQRGGGPRHSGRSAGADAGSETRRGGELERASSAVRVAVAQPLPPSPCPAGAGAGLGGSSGQAPAERLPSRASRAAGAPGGRAVGERWRFEQLVPRLSLGHCTWACLNSISHASHGHPAHSRSSAAGWRPRAGRRTRTAASPSPSMRCLRGGCGPFSRCEHAGNFELVAVPGAAGC